MENITISVKYVVDPWVFIVNVDVCQSVYRPSSTIKETGNNFDYFVLQMTAWLSIYSFFFFFVHFFSFSEVEADLKRVVVVGHINTSSLGYP